MSSVFKKDFNLRTSDFDCFRRLTPSAILDLFQEVAGHHAEELNVGFDLLEQKKLLWVIIKAKYEVISHPEMHSTVTVKTWPLPPSRIGFQREYLIEDMNGNTLIKGTSDWVLMHSEERRLVPTGDIYPENYVFCTDKNFEERTAKIKNFEALNEGIRITPTFCDLDLNGHVNNIKYASYVLNNIGLTENDVIKTFQTDYHREIKRDNDFSLHILREGNTLTAKGEDENGERMFLTRITFM